MSVVANITFSEGTCSITKDDLRKAILDYITETDPTVESKVLGLTNIKELVDKKIDALRNNIVDVALNKQRLIDEQSPSPRPTVAAKLYSGHARTNRQSNESLTTQTQS